MHNQDKLYNQYVAILDKDNEMADDNTRKKLARKADAKLRQLQATFAVKEDFNSYLKSKQETTIKVK